MVNIVRTQKDSATSPRGGEVGEIDTRAPFQSVKAAVSLFGDTITPPQSKQTFHRKTKSHIEGVLDKETEFHFAQKELGRCKTQVKNAETAANKALPQLEKAMKTLLELKDKIKSVNTSTLSIIEDTEALKIKAKELEEAKSSKDQSAEAGYADVVSATRNKYKAATAELDAAKQELSSLRGDFDATMDAKLSALQVAEEAQYVAKQHSDKIIQLTEKIERMNGSLNEIKFSTREAVEEERVRRAEIEEVERKKVALLREKENAKLDGVEVMEEKLEETNKEIEVLKEKVEQAKADLSESEKDAVFQLNAAQEEFKQIERENQSLQELVNALKVELENVGKVKGEIRDKEEQAELLTGQLKSELQEKKHELEEALASEENETKVCYEMVTKLEQLFLETKQAKQEAGELISDAEELQREVKAAEEMKVKMDLVMQEAEEAKAAAESAENELRILKERNAKESENEEKKVPKEEYASLKEKALEPEKIAETKAASAMAEIEALKAKRDESEKRLDEILKEIEELDRGIEEAFRQAEMADSARSMVQYELQRRRQEHKPTHIVF